MTSKIKVTVILLFLLSACKSSVASSVYTHFNHKVLPENDIYESRIIEPDNPMDRAVLSWNAVTPGDSYIVIKLRAGAGKWTGWYTMGIWGTGVSSHSVKNQEFDGGKIDIDTFMLNEPASKWQYMVEFHRSPDGKSPVLHGVALTFKNSKTLKKSKGTISTQILKVPELSQFAVAADYEFARRICSPTSVAMAAKYYGITVKSVTNITKRVYDYGADIYGNWPFNTAALYHLLRTSHSNLFTYIVFYESLDDVARHINDGNPVIVSIGFKEGELDGAPKPSPGHIVVVTGIDDKYVYVNDPATNKGMTVSRKYKKDQFLRAWKGVAYVVDRLAE